MHKPCRCRLLMYEGSIVQIPTEKIWQYVSLIIDKSRNRFFESLLSTIWCIRQHFHLNKIYILRLCKDIFCSNLMGTVLHALLALIHCRIEIHFKSHAAWDDNISNWFFMFRKDTRFIAFALAMKSQASGEYTHTSFFGRGPPKGSVWLLACRLPRQPHPLSLPTHLK